MTDRVEKAWVVTGTDDIRYVHYSVFAPRNHDGELAPRACGECHRWMGVMGEWYFCPDHRYQGKIQTLAEEKEDLASCDPRWRE